jgi:Ca2+-binding RTX toxin-like protein
MSGQGLIGGVDIEGTRRADVLRGTGGNDEIDGNRGDDQLFGRAGNDELDGDQGNDLLRGGTGNDELDGGYGRDRLFGGDGRDRLDGDNGNDRLAGGRGADVFEFETGDDHDVITDWGLGADRIELDDDFGYTGFRQVMRDATQVGDNVVFDFGRGTELTVLDVARADFDAGDFILL